MHLLLHKPVVIENSVHLNRTSRETSFWKTGALKRAVSKVTVKETGVRPSTLVCNLVLFVCHSNVIIHITSVFEESLSLDLLTPDPDYFAIQGFLNFSEPESGSDPVFLATFLCPRVLS